MYVLIVLLALLTVAGFVFLNHPKFGKLPKGERLVKMQKSPNYNNGRFLNLSPTPDLTEGVTFWEVLREFLFSKTQNTRPKETLPSGKTDLLNLPVNQDVLVWFGHSSYFIQIDGKRILVDPVFSGSASPLPGGIKAFPGTERYSVQDLPEIDFLFISHDHWDHLDYKTIIKLKSKVKQVICGLGVGAHLEHWGYDSHKVFECDWNDTLPLGEGFSVTAAPGRHFSGRGLKRNKSLWLSFVLITPSIRIFLGGDSGYDAHFAEIGKLYGPFDLAILENGQYDRKWKYIHLMPHEFLQAAGELKAKRILPVHSAKFKLGNHAWHEPLELLAQNNANGAHDIITPMIGEAVYLKDSQQTFTAWWRGVQ